MLDSRDPDLETAKEILARLERYAAKVRASGGMPATNVATALPTDAPPTYAPPTAPPRSAAELPWLHIPQPATRQLDDQLPTLSQPATQRRSAPRRRIDPATVDLFPYDLGASIIACALTVFAFAASGALLGVIMTVALVVGGVAARQFRYFPSVGVKALIGTAFGLLLVFLS
jgi:hypothetical protein